MDSSSDVSDNGSVFSDLTSYTVDIKWTDEGANDNRRLGPVGKSANGPVYRVFHVVDCLYMATGWYIKIRWLGWGRADDTWEPNTYYEVDRTLRAITDHRPSETLGWLLYCEWTDESLEPAFWHEALLHPWPGLVNQYKDANNLNYPRIADQLP